MSATIDPGHLGASEAYRLMTGIVVPRPIAWVTTLNAEGGVNLAPFSCYTFVSHQPVLVGISIGRRPSGRKDTARNILREGEFILNVAHESEADLVHRSSEPLPPDVSEVELLGLSTSPSRLRTPRLFSAPVALECVLERVVAFGDAPSEFFVGRVDLVYVREGLHRNGRIESDELRPLARVAGPNYSRVETILRYSPRYQQFPDRSSPAGEERSGA